MIRYILDLAERTTYPPELALRTTTYAHEYNIFLIKTGPHPTTSNYWTTWGGTYDTPTNSDLELYFSQFLQKVTSSAVLLSTENSFFIDGNNVYINLPRKPWLYLTSETEYQGVQGYSSAVRDPLKQSDNTFEDEIGAFIKHPVKLLIPSVVNKLSDPIAGATLQSTFSVSLINNDGKFDDTDKASYTNTPMRLKRSDVDNPKLSDFKVIRYGLFGSSTITGTEFTISGEDINRTLTESVCNTFTVSEYPSLPDTNIDKNIPVAWGSQSGIKLFEVAAGKYIALDKDYITAVTTVYDKDGASISFSADLSTGIISATDAKTADVTGKANNTIGEIITSEIELKSNIPYREAPWDKTEADRYLDISAHINFYFVSGNVKTLVNAVLKNDNAFLFTKNDGRLTLRQWGQSYTDHIIRSEMIMKLPDKNNSEAKDNFMSAVLIKYDKNEGTKEYDNQHLDDSQQRSITQEYNKLKTQEFPTDLYLLPEVQDLADRLLNRFGTIAELTNVPLGVPTIDINPLDTVILDLNINGRTMSNFNGWIVRTVNPAQDTLVLESSNKLLVYDLILGIGDTTEFALGITDGDMILGPAYKTVI